MTTDIWWNCYNEGWGDELVPEAFAHPAKNSPGLSKRIYDHAFDEGWLVHGSLVLDMFGGVGGFALQAMAHGCEWIGCELEPRFCLLGNQNISLWNRRYSRFPRWCSRAVLLQGDSRNLLAVVQAGLAEACVSSPPYANSMDSEKNGIDWTKVKKDYPGRVMHDERIAMAESHHNERRYGDGHGQLGSMRPGDFDAALSSPPYADITNVGERRDPQKSIDAEIRYRAAHPELEGKRPMPLQPYGITDGNLGAMKAGQGDFDAAVNAGSIDNNSLFCYNGYKEDSEHGSEITIGGSALQDVPERNVNGRDRRKIRGQIFVSPKEIDESGIQTSQSFGSTQADVQNRTAQTNCENWPESLGMEGRQGETRLSQQGTKRSVRELRIASELGDTSQGLGSLQQRNEQSASSVCVLPHEPTQEGVLASEERGQDTAEVKRPNGLAEETGGCFDLAASSPPFEKTGADDTRQSGGMRDTENLHDLKIYTYGSTDGNIGASSGDTFWSAALTIVQQTYAALRPGGHAIWIVKSFVRNKAIVDFPGQWRKLCESCGFVTEHHAMLVAEHGQTAFDGTHKRRERKSFFRRLAESKGSPRIDYEVVLCQVKPVLPIDKSGE